MAMMYQPPELPKEAIDGATAMNIAVNDEVQKQRQNLLEAAREQAYLQDPTLKFVPRELAKGLIADKMDWQKAYEAGDPQGMAAATLNAQSRRERAQAIGWDPAAYGENVSLVEAAQNLANNDTRALNDIFYNLKNTGRTYTQDVADYLDQGYSIDSAKRLAEQNAEYNTQDNMNSLVDAFHMYGTDPRGAINANGLRILGQMAQAGGASPSELANFYAQMQASPKDSWNFENSQIAAQNAQGYALDRMARSQQYTRENQASAFAQQEKMARLSNDLGIQRMMAQAQIQINSGIMSKEAGYNWTVQKLMEAGVDEMTARQYAATRLLSGGKGGTGSGATAGYNSKMVGDLQKERDAVVAQINEAKLSGDEATAKALQERADMLQMRIDSALGLGGGSNSNGPDVDVNDYNSLREHFQGFVNEYGDRMTRAQLKQTFLDNVGHDNPLAQNIVDNVEWGDNNTAKVPEQPKEQPKETSEYTVGTPSGLQTVSRGRDVIDWLKDNALHEVYDSAGKKRIGAATLSDALAKGYIVHYNTDGSIQKFVAPE